MVPRCIVQVHLEVDGQYKERWTSPSSFSLLSSSRVFVAGGPRVDKTRNVNLTTMTNFTGCLRKVSFLLSFKKLATFSDMSTCYCCQVAFQADSIHLPILEMAKENHPLITSQGEIDFRCKHSANRDTATFQDDGIRVR